ncbi:MAG: hypothetical protein QXT28_06365 [Thermofilaceae archaeon]
MEVRYLAVQCPRCGALRLVSLSRGAPRTAQCFRCGWRIDVKQCWRRGFQTWGEAVDYLKRRR